MGGGKDRVMRSLFPDSRKIEIEICPGGRNWKLDYVKASKKKRALVAREVKKASDAIRAYIPRGYKHFAVGEGRERERGNTFFAVSKIAESGLRLWILDAALPRQRHAPREHAASASRVSARAASLSSSALPRFLSVPVSVYRYKYRTGHVIEPTARNRTTESHDVGVGSLNEIKARASGLRARVFGTSSEQARVEWWRRIILERTLKNDKRQASRKNNLNKAKVLARETNDPHQLVPLDHARVWRLTMERNIPGDFADSAGRDKKNIRHSRPRRGLFEGERKVEKF